MDYPRLIEKVYEHLECNDVDKAVMTCLRLARHLRDYYNSTMFLRELYPDVCQLRQAFYDDTNGLKEEAIKYLWEKSQEDWLNGRTLGFSISSEDRDKNVLVYGVGELKSELDQLEKSIEDMRLPNGMGEFDLAAFTDRYSSHKAQFRLMIKGIHTINDRIKTRCLNYAIRLEKQLEAQNKSVVFLHTIQNEVNNYFKVNSEDVYMKLQKAAQLVDTTDPEDQSLLLTLVRRAIKAVADYFYPPVDGTVKCSDGEDRVLNDERYLNRLQEYLTVSFAKSSSNVLLQAELEHLIAVARKLNDIASKGVHTDVSFAEAKQGLVCLYMFLYNLTSKLQYKGSQE